MALDIPVSPFPEPMKKPSFFERLKEYFLYGLIVVLPIMATVWVLKVVVKLLSGPFYWLNAHNVPQMVQFLLSIVLITFVGFFARQFVGVHLLRFFEWLVLQIPVVKTIYTSSKDIVEAFAIKDRAGLVPVMVAYPRKGLWSIGFLTRQDASGIFDRKGAHLTEGMCSVFVPTVPNPTTGFFLLLKLSEVHVLDMQIEEAVKLIMSVGVVQSRKP